MVLVQPFPDIVHGFLIIKIVVRFMQAVWVYMKNFIRNFDRIEKLVSSFDSKQRVFFAVHAHYRQVELAGALIDPLKGF